MGCRDRPFVARNVAALEYRGVVKEVISLYKLAGKRELGRLLSALILATVADALAESVVIPIPPSRRRRRSLGWDPVRELLTNSAKRVGATVMPIVVRKGTTQQKELGYEERLVNAGTLFSLSTRGTSSVAASASRGRPIVLFDDVYTTGATLSAVCGCLRDSGIAVDHTVTLAVD